MEIIALLLMLYGLYSLIKRFSRRDNVEKHAHHSYNNSLIQIVCPNCNYNVTIRNDEGNWSCYNCEKAFIYYKGSTYQGNKYHSIFAMYATAVLAKFSKLDGIVTKDELRIVENQLKQYVNPTGEEMRNLKSLFNKELKTSEEFYTMITEFANLNQVEGEVFELLGEFLLDSFLAIYYANDPDTHDVDRLEKGIHHLIKEFNIHTQLYENLKAHYEGREYKRGSTNYKDMDNLDKYYEVLGLDRDATAKEIRKQYRQLSRKYHPDTVAGKDLPPKIVKLIESKFKEINKADQILKEHVK